MTHKELLQLLPRAVTIFGGRLLDKKSYVLLKKVVQYCIQRDWYIVTGGLSMQKSVMLEPIRLADNKVITLYSRDDEVINQDLILTERKLSFMAHNFGDQIYLMIQTQAMIIFEGGLSTLAEMTLALDYWKRYNNHTAKKPIILFFGRKWLGYREDMIEDGLIDKDSVRNYCLYCHGYKRFQEKFERFFPV